MLKKHEKYFLNYILEYKALLGLSLFFIIINNLISILIVYFFKVIIDNAIPNSNIKEIYSISAILTGALLLNILIHKGSIHFSNVFANRFQHHVRDSFFNHIQGIHYMYFSANTYGELNTKIIQDIESLSDIFFKKLLTAFTQIIYFIVTFILLFTTNKQLSLLLYGLMLLFMLIIVKLKSVMSRCYEAYAKARTDLNLAISDLTDGIDIIQCYNAGSYFTRKVEDCNNRLIKKWLVTNVFGPTIRSSIEIAILLTYLITFFLGAKYIKAGHLTAGELLLFISYFPRLWDKIGSVTDIFSGIIDLKVYIKRVFSHMTDYPNTLEKEEVLTTHLDSNVKIDASIHIQNLVFSYTNKSTPIFNDFSLSITKPGLYCISGKSGIGKSTLFNLLLKFYMPNHGQIAINGKNIDYYSDQDLRRIIGIVHQDMFLLQGTVLDNITLNDPSINDEHVINLSKQLGFHDYMITMTHGYSTQLTTSGKHISAGQKRMITILRVLCRQPQIILLDEITSNVDSFTEQLIRQFIKDLAKKKICMYITHKEADRLYADQVFHL